MEGDGEICVGVCKWLLWGRYGDSLKNHHKVCGITHLINDFLNLSMIFDNFTKVDIINI